MTKKTMKRVFALLTPVLVLGLTVAATTLKPELGFGKAAFERIKSLAGNAVLELLFPGTEKEMVTVYHLDGDELVLQHYCILGNQPRMKVRPGKNADELAFEFAGCCNLVSDDARHMREATITILGRDRIRSRWYQYENRENSKTVEFDLARRHR